MPEDLPDIYPMVGGDDGAQSANGGIEEYMMKTPKVSILTQLLFATFIPMLVVFLLVSININQVIMNLGGHYAKENSAHMADTISRQMQSVLDVFSIQAEMLARDMG